MKFDQPTIVHTTVFPRVWLPEKEARPAHRDDPEDVKLSERLFSLAHDSYSWNRELFSERVDQLEGRSARYFEAQPGPFWWRLLAFVYVPLNYAIILCSPVFLIGLVALLYAWTWAAGFGLVPPFSNQPWLYDYFVYDAALVLAGAFALAVVVGFGFALYMACDPRSASARGFAYVAEDSTATIVFCGSKIRHHFTINAVVWPWIRPRRHAGFVRAWRHIQKDVEDWLKSELPNGGEIILTGHSLGGAIAQIAAYELRLPKLPLPNAYQVKHVVCWGSPRIGGARMRGLYRKSNKPNLHRNTRHIMRGGDIIPFLPPPPFYKHVGREFALSEDGVPVEGAAAPFWLSFLKIVQDVQEIWRKGPSSDGIFALEAASQNYTADGLMARRFARKFSRLKWLTWEPQSLPLAVVVTASFSAYGAYDHFVRLLIFGFYEHRKELYLRMLRWRARLTPAAAPRPPAAIPLLLGATLIDLNDGAYKEGMSQAFKRGHFPEWRLDRANPVLTAEQSEEIDIRAKAAFLNTGHILAAWATGHDIILERFKGDDYWNWHYAYGGSRDQAIEEVKQLLQRPLDDSASRETDMPRPAAPPLKPTSESPATE